MEKLPWEFEMTPKWRALTDEEHALIRVGCEGGMLIEVIDGWRARRLWRETGTSLTPSDLTDWEREAVVPLFADAALRLIERGWLEAGESAETEDRGLDYVLLSGEALRVTLQDPYYWIWTPEKETDTKVIIIMTTDLWDNLD